MKAVVNQSICIGCGLCEQTCPEVFSMDSDMKAIAIPGEIPPQHRDAAQRAREQCPVDAISI